MSSWRLPYGLAAGRGGATGLTDPLTADGFTWLRVYDAGTTFAATADTTAVSSWADRSANAVAAAQADGAKQPTVQTASGKKCVRFDATNDCLTMTLAPGVNAITVYAVFSAPSGTDRIVAEASANYSVNNGSWIMYRTAANKLAVGLKGASATSVEWTTDEAITTTPALAYGRYDMGLNRHEAMGGVGGLLNGDWSSLSTVTGAYNTGTFASFAVNIGSRNNGAALPLGGDLFQLWIASGRHNPGQRETVEQWLSDRTGASRTAIAGGIVFEGDSLTEGDAAFNDSYPEQLMEAVTMVGNYDWINTGLSGQTLVQMDADYATQILPFKSSSSAHSNTVVLWGGTNDMSSPGANQSAATTLTRFYAYADKIRADGFKLVGLTMIPRDDAAAPADFETKRLAFNTDVRANWASHFDALCDPALDSRFDEEADTLNATNYNADLVHLTATGYGAIAGMVETTLATIGIT